LQVPSIRGARTLVLIVATEQLQLRQLPRGSLPPQVGN
jgi:hypothetical protein